MEFLILLLQLTLIVCSDNDEPIFKTFSCGLYFENSLANEVDHQNLIFFAMLEVTQDGF